MTDEKESLRYSVIPRFDRGIHLVLKKYLRNKNWINFLTWKKINFHQHGIMPFRRFIGQHGKIHDLFFLIDINEFSMDGSLILSFLDKHFNPADLLKKEVIYFLIGDNDYLQAITFSIE